MLGFEDEVWFSRLALDTLGHLLAAHVTPAAAQDRAQVKRLATAVQAATGGTVEVAFGPGPHWRGAGRGGRRPWHPPLIVVKRTEAKKGFVPLLQRWAVERSLACAARCRRRARDHERRPETLA